MVLPQHAVTIDFLIIEYTNSNWEVKCSANLSVDWKVANAMFVKSQIEGLEKRMTEETRDITNQLNQRSNEIKNHVSLVEGKVANQTTVLKRKVMEQGSAVKQSMSSQMAEIRNGVSQDFSDTLAEV